MRLRSIFLVFTLLTLGRAASAQVNLDSLWAVWNDHEQQDTVRLKALGIFCDKGFVYARPDSAFALAQMQYELAEEIEHEKYMVQALINQGRSRLHQSRFDEARMYLTRGLQRSVEIGFASGEAAALNNLGITLESTGDYAGAIDHYMKSLKIREALGDKKGAASCLNNIGLVYWAQDDLERAIDFNKQSLALKEEIGHQSGIAITLNNLGLIYKDQGDFEAAKRTHERSLEIYRSLDHEQGIASALSNLGLAYQSLESYEKALALYKESLQRFERNGYLQGVAINLNNMGQAYAALGNLKQARIHSQKALDVALDVGAIIEARGAAESLWMIEKDLGNHQRSLEMYELFISIRDSIRSEENQQAIIRQEYKYAYEKQAAADSIKAAEAKKVMNAQLAAQEAQLEKEKSQRYALWGGLGLLALFGGVMFNRFQLTSKQKDIISEQKQTVESQKAEVDFAHAQLTEKNREILDSIAYAKRIQQAILPPDKLFKEHLPESFVLYLPKDVVAGDFYWMEAIDDLVCYAAADCTGHGVPGAMVSVVCVNGLNRSVREFGLPDPAEILDKTRALVIQEFEKSEEEVKDGMDISLCVFNTKTRELRWAGAHNPLWIVSNHDLVVRTSHTEEAGIRKLAYDTKTLYELRADKQPIGKYINMTSFTTHEIQLHKGDILYTFTDGFPDQFGGEHGKKFKSGSFKRALLRLSSESIEHQGELLRKEFESWRGEHEQIDDVCVIGVRV
jgi:serine phosphatase RsbU (regulator of sigma subunit)